MAHGRLLRGLVLWRRRAQGSALMRRSALSMLNVQLRRGWEAVAEASGEALAWRALSTRSGSHARGRLLGRAWGRWVAKSGNLRRRFRTRRAAIEHWREGLLLGAIRTWCGVAAARRGAVGAARRALAQSRRLSLGGQFGLWRRDSALNGARRQGMRKMVQRMRHRGLGLGWESWHAWWSERARILAQAQRCLAAIRSKGLYAALVRWREVHAAVRAARAARLEAKEPPPWPEAWRRRDVVSPSAMADAVAAAAEARAHEAELRRHLASLRSTWAGWQQQQRAPRPHRSPRAPAPPAPDPEVERQKAARREAAQQLEALRRAGVPHHELPTEAWLMHTAETKKEQEYLSAQTALYRRQQEWVAAHSLTPPPAHIVRTSAAARGGVVHGLDGPSLGFPGRSMTRRDMETLAASQAMQAAARRQALGSSEAGARGAAAMQAASPEEPRGRRRTRARVEQPRGRPPPSPLAGVLMAAARATLSRERLQEQLQVARGGDTTAAVKVDGRGTSPASAEPAQVVLLAREGGVREPFVGGGATVVSSSSNSAPSGAAPALGGYASAADPRRDTAVLRCGWGAKIRM